MVDGVSPRQNVSSDLTQATGLGQSEQIEKTNKDSSASSLLEQKEYASDPAAKVNISRQAVKLAEAERAVQAFTLLSVRQDEEFDTDKVAKFKKIYENPSQLSSYLDSLSNETLAGNLLDSPIASGLFR